VTPVVWMLGRGRPGFAGGLSGPSVGVFLGRDKWGLSRVRMPKLEGLLDSRVGAAMRAIVPSAVDPKHAFKPYERAVRARKRSSAEAVVAPMVVICLWL
jgi:hypothetical protein